jgi:hypothetical protein
MVIKSVGAFSCAKIMGTLYVIIGLVFGGLVSLVAMAGFGRGGSGFGGALFGIGAVIILPIFYGVLGFVATLIGAWLYNLAAGIVGGVELETE